MPNDPVSEPTPSLDDIPLFAAFQDESEPEPVSTRADRGDSKRNHRDRAAAFGVYPASELGHFARLVQAPVDWPQVVALRKEASSLITEEGQAYLTRTGLALTGDDRLLMGRSIIRRVVGDHVRSLHREGADLWSPAQELGYVQAVEDAVFGYGRLQPLLEMQDVENIEIHGWDSVVVQYGNGRREKMPPVADSDEELIDAIRFLGQNSQPSRPLTTPIPR